MALSRVTLKLTTLRCISQSEGSDGSEPYLWTTFFAFGARQVAGQSGLVHVQTPSYNAFRNEFPNRIKAGSVVDVPPFPSTGRFDFDFDQTFPPKVLGVIALLLEEDETKESAMIAGRIAYAKEIQVQLEALFAARLAAGNTGPLTTTETEAIKNAVDAKVRAAVKDRQSWWDLLWTDQDDSLGFTFRLFTGNAGIVNQSFDLPEIVKGSDRFILSGTLDVAPVPVVICGDERADLKAQQDLIASLHEQVRLLQRQLHQAGPGEKPAILAMIRETREEIAAAEAVLPRLEAALDACILRGGAVTGGTTGGVLVDH